MGKYEPLTRFLSEQHVGQLPMTFAEIEAIVGGPLPNSSRTLPAWWNNNPSNNVMAEAWLAAGYEATEVDLTAETLMFRRVDAHSQAESASAPPASPAMSRRHPVFGAMKGLLTLSPDLDLTQPADPDWGAGTDGR